MSNLVTKYIYVSALKNNIVNIYHVEGTISPLIGNDNYERKTYLHFPVSLFC
jgi:hypothetical protein